MLDLLISAWYLVPVGVFAGFIAGFFGIGGGIVLVPAFLTFVPLLGGEPSILMHMAVGTASSLIVPGSLSSAYQQYRLGHLDMKLFQRWIAPVFLGVLFSVFFFNKIPSRALQIFFSIYLMAVAIYALFPKRVLAPGPLYLHFPKFFAFIIGAFSMCLGIGGGTFTVPYFKFSHYPLKKAIAISSATSLVIGLAGTLGIIFEGWSRWGRPTGSLGYLYLPAFLWMTPLMLLFAPLGALSAHALPERILNRLYQGFFIIMAAYVGFKTFF